MAEQPQNPNSTDAGADPSAPVEAEGQTEQMVEQALAEAQAAVSQMTEETDGAGGTAAASNGRGDFNNAIDLLGDVDLDVMVELGRTEMLVEDVLRLGEGSVVELDKLAGDPVDVYVNNRLIARGEVLVLNDNFCIRINEIVDDLQQQAAAAAEEVAHT